MMKEANTPTIFTERLILRKFTLQDMEALFRILQDEEVNRFLPWYPVKDLEENETVLRRTIRCQIRPAAGLCLRDLFERG